MDYYLIDKFEEANSTTNNRIRNKQLKLFEKNYFSHGTIIKHLIEIVRNKFKSTLKQKAFIKLNLNHKKQHFLYSKFSNLNSILNWDCILICSPTGINKSTKLFSSLINSVNKKNAFIIYPSGNKGNGTVLSPGIHPEVFCVGAIDKNGNIAPFSGRMYDEDGNCLKPEVCALGADVEVELEDGSKHVVSGTSFACAQVAGVAAALFEANPKATVNDIKMALIESCTPAEGSRFGNINPEKALELIKTKVPYQEQFETIPEPEWFNEQYIDYRLISQCNRARKNNKDVEGLIVGEDTNALIKRLKEEMSEYISEYNPFINFDMAHIIAKPEFYDALFKQPDLEVASAVDINYFDM